MAQPDGQASSESFSITVDGDEFWPLRETILSRHHRIITFEPPHHWVLPRKLKLGISHQVPVSVSCNGKIWEINGNPKIYPGFKKFVAGNNLKFLDLKIPVLCYLVLDGNSANS